MRRCRREFRRRLEKAKEKDLAAGGAAFFGNEIQRPSEKTIPASAIEWFFGPMQRRKGPKANVELWLSDATNPWRYVWM